MLSILVSIVDVSPRVRRTAHSIHYCRTVWTDRSRKLPRVLDPVSCSLSVDTAGDVMRWHDAGGGAVGEGAELSIDLGLLSRLLLERRDYDPDL